MYNSYVVGWVQYYVCFFPLVAFARARTFAWTIAAVKGRVRVYSFEYTAILREDMFTKRKKEIDISLPPPHVSITATAYMLPPVPTVYESSTCYNFMAIPCSQSNSHGTQKS